MLTEYEYDYLQSRFDNKLKTDITNKAQAYNSGVLACKSILSSFYRKTKAKKEIKE